MTRETVTFRVKWPPSYGLFGVDAFDFGNLPGAHFVRDTSGAIVLFLPEPFALAVRSGEQLSEEKAATLREAFAYFGVAGRS